MGSRCKPWNTESGSDIAADQCGDLQHLHCRAARSSLPAKIDRPPYQTLHMARGFEIRAELLARRTRPDVDQGRTHRSGETNLSPKTTVDSLFDDGLGHRSSALRSVAATIVEELSGPVQTGDQSNDVSNDFDGGDADNHCSWTQLYVGQR
jgi:hypothetical protein